MEKLSVIIPTFIQKSMSVDRLLLTIKGYTLQSLNRDDFELVIVDDGSEINVEEAVTAVFGVNSYIKIFRQEHAGMCTAINKGVELASGKYVLIAVDDNIPQKDALKNLLDKASNGLKRDVYIGSEPFLNFVAGMNQLIEPSYFRGIQEQEYKKKYQKEFLDFRGITFEDVENRFDILLSLSEEIEVNKCFKDFLGDSRFSDRHWLCVRPGALVIERDFFNELGGFDTNLDPIGWYSDLDFGYRITKRDGTIKYISESIFIHLNHIKLNAVPKVEANSYEYIIKKHNSIEMILLPLLWHGSDLRLFSKLVERTKDYIRLKNT